MLKVFNDDHSDGDDMDYMVAVADNMEMSMVQDSIVELVVVCDDVELEVVVDSSVVDDDDDEVDDVDGDDDHENILDPFCLCNKLVR